MRDEKGGKSLSATFFYLPDESQINKHHNKNDDDHHHHRRSETAERSPEGISHDLNLLIFMLVKYM